jgi:outer membrane lipoprotein-sorting protein
MRTSLGLFRAGFLGACWLWGSALAQDALPVGGSFQNEPAARALYDQMLGAMRQADTLSWVGDYRWEARGQTLGHATYRIWLKKPNYARLEAMRAGTSQPTGILVGDGEYFWIYWPTGKPRYGFEYKGTCAEEYEKYQGKFYSKIRTPPGRHSLAHETGELGAGMAMTILDPSTFHGYTDSLQQYIDAVRAMPVEKVGNEECDVVEVSIMKHQRSWFLWLAKKDHLPHKLKQIIRVSSDILMEESWSEVTVDAPLANDRFAWSVLGVNPSDDRKIALDYLKANQATFPNVLDSSGAAQRAMSQYETLAGMSAVPMTYVIDRDGKVLDAWYGFDKGREQKALKTLGL